MEKKGFLHRDIKPANVLYNKDGKGYIFKLGDFGLVKLRRGATSMTNGVGDPQYVAPEQFEGEADYDSKVDVYSMGAMMFEFVVGEDPVTAGCYKLRNETINYP